MARDRAEQAGELYQGCYPQLFELLGHFVIPHDVRDDLLQEVAIRFVRAFCDKNIEKPIPFLKTMVRNTATNWLRDNRRKARIEKDGWQFLRSSESPSGSPFRDDKKMIPRLLGLFPGADAEAVRLLLQYGDYEHAARSLLEREGLAEIGLKKKKQRLRTYVDRFAQRMRNLPDCDRSLIALFQWRQVSRLVDRLSGEFGYRDHRDCNDLIVGLESFPSNNNKLVDVASRIIPQSRTLTFLASILLSPPPLECPYSLDYSINAGRMMNHVLINVSQLDEPSLQRIARKRHTEAFSSFFDQFAAMIYLATDSDLAELNEMLALPGDLQSVDYTQMCLSICDRLAVLLKESNLENSVVYAVPLPYQAFLALLHSITSAYADLSPDSNPEERDVRIATTLREPKLIPTHDLSDFADFLGFATVATPDNDADDEIRSAGSLLYDLRYQVFCFFDRLKYVKDPVLSIECLFEAADRFLNQNDLVHAKQCLGMAKNLIEGIMGCEFTASLVDE